MLVSHGDKIRHVYFLRCWNREGGRGEVREGDKEGGRGEVREGRRQEREEGSVRCRESRMGCRYC